MNWGHLSALYGLARGLTDISIRKCLGMDLYENSLWVYFLLSWAVWEIAQEKE